MIYELILDPLENAIKSLHQAMTDYKKDEAEYTRDACIKRFEYCYELSHKMLKRHLELTVASPTEIDEYTFSQLIRTGYEKGLLLNSWDKWSLYRNNRNKTSHGYNEQNAIDIVAGLDNFLDESLYLLDKLKQGND